MHSANNTNTWHPAVYARSQQISNTVSNIIPQSYKASIENYHRPQNFFYMPRNPDSDQGQPLQTAKLDPEQLKRFFEPRCYASPNYQQLELKIADNYKYKNYQFQNSYSLMDLLKSFNNSMPMIDQSVVPDHTQLQGNYQGNQKQVFTGQHLSQKVSTQEPQTEGCLLLPKVEQNSGELDMVFEAFRSPEDCEEQITQIKLEGQSQQQCLQRLSSQASSAKNSTLTNILRNSQQSNSIQQCDKEQNSKEQEDLVLKKGQQASQEQEQVPSQVIKDLEASDQSHAAAKGQGNAKKYKQCAHRFVFKNFGEDFVRHVLNEKSFQKILSDCLPETAQQAAFFHWLCEKKGLNQMNGKSQFAEAWTLRSQDNLQIKNFKTALRQLSEIYFFNGYAQNYIATSKKMHSSSKLVHQDKLLFFQKAFFNTEMLFKRSQRNQMKK